MKPRSPASEQHLDVPLDLPSSPRRPIQASLPRAGLPQSGLPIAIVTDDPLVESALHTRLAPASWIVPDPARAAVILWDPPTASPDELPTLPIEPGPGPDQNPEPPPVIALIDDDTDPMPLLAAGVRGLIRRNVDAERLRATITAVGLGLTVLDDDPADAVVAAWSPTPEPEPPPPSSTHLTPREREVLERLADGLSNRAIGESLGISSHTVKFHVDALLDKLAARSRTQVVVKAMREGLLLV